MEHEKRKFSRVEFNTSGEINYKGKILKGKVHDLSLKGMFLETEEHVQDNSEVDIKIHLGSSTSELVINCKGEIVRNVENGLAIQFNTMDIDSFMHLKNVVEYNFGNANRIMEEFTEFIKNNAQ